MRQLGVTDFVKWAFAVRASQEKISETDERDQFETGLINDVVACCYGFERDSPRFGSVPARHAENFLARSLQVLEVIGLVLFPCVGHQPLLGRFFVRLHPVGEFQVKPLHPTCIGRIEKPDEIRGRIYQLAAAFLHD